MTAPIPQDGPNTSPANGTLANGDGGYLGGTRHLYGITTPPHLKGYTQVNSLQIRPTHGNTRAITNAFITFIFPTVYTKRTCLFNKKQQLPAGQADQ